MKIQIQMHIAQIQLKTQTNKYKQACKHTNKCNKHITNITVQTNIAININIK